MKRISYEHSIYESVDNKILFKIISQNKREKILGSKGLD